MVETVLISISCAVSLLAGVLAVFAMKASDPIGIQKLIARVNLFEIDTTNKLKSIREEEIPLVEAHAEAILERADLRFESAEAKRKSVAARQRHGGAGGPDPSNGEGAAWLDPSIPEADRRDALGRAFRGRG